MLVCTRTRKRCFVPELFVFKSVGLGSKVTGILDDIYAEAFQALVLEVLYLVHSLLDAVKSSGHLVLTWTRHVGLSLVDLLLLH